MVGMAIRRKNNQMALKAAKLQTEFDKNHFFIILFFLTLYMQNMIYFSSFK